MHIDISAYGNIPCSLYSNKNFWSFQTNCDVGSVQNYAILYANEKFILGRKDL